MPAGISVCRTQSKWFACGGGGGGGEAGSLEIC